MFDQKKLTYEKILEFKGVVESSTSKDSERFYAGLCKNLVEFLDIKYSKKSSLDVIELNLNFMEYFCNLDIRSEKGLFGGEYFSIPRPCS